MWKYPIWTFLTGFVTAGTGLLAAILVFLKLQAEIRELIRQNDLKWPVKSNKQAIKQINGDRKT